MQNKTKVIVATEELSSMTVRLTPKDVGELLVKMSPVQMKECFKHYMRDSYYIRKCDWDKKRAILKTTARGNNDKD